MEKYIGIVLTNKGTFCIAPPWTVHEGDMVCLENAITGEKVVEEVISVATDSVGGDQITMLCKYAGGRLPKVTEKYKRYRIEWEEENVQE